MQRLKTRAQFQAVLAGQTVARTPHFVLHRVRLELPAGAEQATTGPGPSGQQALFAVREPWIGAMVPKRWARRAVTRNVIKRQIYSVSQSFEVRMLVAAHVVRLRTGFDRKVFISASSDLLKQAVRGELVRLFEQATA